METKKTIDILSNLIVDDRLDADERTAISDSCNYMRTLELKEGNQYGFQGWKVKKITMKQLRKFVRDNGSLDDDVNILVLEDDGMGYGARNGYCSDIYVSENKDGKKEIQIWF